MWVDKITKINLIRSHPKNKNHYLSEGIEEGEPLFLTFLNNL